MTEDATDQVLRKEVAFALGGLGGSNAHGVGFLHAANLVGIKPGFISCTSGMIYWVWRWLEGVDLKAEFERTVASEHAFTLPGSGVKFSPAAWEGVPGVFGTAWQDNWFDFMKRLPSAMPEDWLGWLMPARWFIPTRPFSDFERIAAVFNSQKIPVLFNSYDVRHGIEYLHANDAGLTMLNKLRARRKRLRPDDEATRTLRKGASLPKVREAVIDAEAVRDALWLTLYGFGSADHPQERIDGAYVRQFILSECRDASFIVMPRPQSCTWQGPLPTNWFELQDLQTELWFNAPYMQQVARIDLVNRLVRQGVLKEPDYHEILLRPVEIDVQRGYFCYFLEDMEVFHRAVELGVETLIDLKEGRSGVG